VLIICRGNRSLPRREGKARAAVTGLLAAAAAVLCLTGTAAASAAAPPPGSALGWGLNTLGQLGDGSSTLVRTTPVAAHLPAGVLVTAVAAGDNSSLALTSDGRVLAWGWNLDGQLGDGTTTSRPTPVAVHLPKGTHVTAIDAGAAFSLALTSDGRVLAWGDNTNGQLGVGTPNTRSLTPVGVHLPAGTRVKAIAAGNAFGLALTSDGRVLAWGDNQFGQLGDGGTESIALTPVRVHLPAGSRATAIAAAAYVGLALTPGGSRVLSWGNDANGALGNGTVDVTSNVPTPVHLPAGSRVTAIGAGGGVGMAVLCSGRVLAWGWNFYGQVGDGTITDKPTPVPVHLPKGTRVTAVAPGDIFSLALTSRGQVLAWGNGFTGQLGNGAIGNSSTPVWVHLPAGTRATAIAADTNHDLAVTVP
jgi:alpha-tubulin suppressor-like RCC1 family protein